MGDNLIIRMAVKVAIAASAGWFTWLWFINLWAQGEASFGGAVPMNELAWTWTVLALAGIAMFVTGAISRSQPWGLCTIAASYPMWRFMRASEPQLAAVALAGGAIFVYFACMSALGRWSRRSFCRLQ